MAGLIMEERRLSLPRTTSPFKLVLPTPDAQMDTQFFQLISGSVRGDQALEIKRVELEPALDGFYVFCVIFNALAFHVHDKQS